MPPTPIYPYISSHWQICHLGCSGNYWIRLDQTILESENEQEKQRDGGALSNSQNCPWEWDLTAAPFVKSIKLSAAICFISEKAFYVCHYHLCPTWFCLHVFLCACVCVRGLPLPSQVSLPTSPLAPLTAPWLTACQSFFIVRPQEPLGQPSPGRKVRGLTACGSERGVHYAAFGLVTVRLELWKGFRICIFFQTSFTSLLLLHCSPSCLFSLTFLR